jgi:hypothetical protein
MVTVADELDVLDPRRKKIRQAAAQTQGGKRRPRELTVYLLDVIEVDVTIPPVPTRSFIPRPVRSASGWMRRT